MDSFIAVCQEFLEQIKKNKNISTKIKFLEIEKEFENPCFIDNFLKETEEYKHKIALNDISILHDLVIFNNLLPLKNLLTNKIQQRKAIITWLGNLRLLALTIKGDASTKSDSKININPNEIMSCLQDNSEFNKIFQTVFKEMQGDFESLQNKLSSDSNGNINPDELFKSILNQKNDKSNTKINDILNKISSKLMKEIQDGRIDHSKLQKESETVFNKIFS
jgi:hypothetical protein